MKMVHVQNVKRNNIAKALSDLDCKLYLVGDPKSITSTLFYYTQEELVNLNMVGIYTKTPEDAVKVYTHMYNKLHKYSLFNPNSYLLTFQNSYCEIGANATPNTDPDKEPECKCNLMIGHGPNCLWKKWKDNQ